MITDEMLQHAHGRITGANRVKFIDGEAWIPLPTKERTRAALEAVLPMIRAEVLEECAKVAEEHVQTWSTGYELGRLGAARDIAAAIRAMKGDKP